MFENKISLVDYYDLQGPCFDNHHKPVYIMRYPEEFNRDIMIAAYEELLDATSRVIGPFAMVVDITQIRAGNAEGRKLAASYADRLESVVSATQHCVGLAIVAARAWQRGLFTAVSWLRTAKQDYPTQTFSDQRDAIEWLQAQLLERLDSRKSQASSRS